MPIRHSRRFRQNLLFSVEGIDPFFGQKTFLSSRLELQELDNRQITHLICVRLKYLLYDFLEGVLGLLPVVSYIEGHSLKKSYSKCFRRTEIR